MITKDILQARNDALNQGIAEHTSHLEDCKRQIEHMTKQAHLHQMQINANHTAIGENNIWLAEIAKTEEAHGESLTLHKVEAEHVEPN